MYYFPKHYQIQELVPRIVYQEYGDGSVMFLRPELLMAVDGIWEYFSETVRGGVIIIINDWHWGSHSPLGGQYEWSGLRLPNHPNWGDLEPHGKGAGADLKILARQSMKLLDADQIRQEIIGHKDDPRFEKIMRMEKSVSWVHVDTYNVPNRIFMFGKG